MNKIFTILFLFLTALSLTFIFQAKVCAADSIVGGSVWSPPDLKIKIPGIENFSTPTDCKDNNGNPAKCVPWIGEYIVGIYNFATAIVGILAAIMIIVGGVRWLTAGGDGGAVTEAQNMIKGALMGLILTFASYMVLNLINPKLTNFGQGIAVVGVKPDNTPSATPTSKWCYYKADLDFCSYTQDECNKNLAEAKTKAPGMTFTDCSEIKIASETETREKDCAAVTGSTITKDEATCRTINCKDRGGIKVGPAVMIDLNRFCCVCAS